MSQLLKRQATPETHATLGDVRPEIELLLCCARVSMDAATRARAEGLLRGDLDWDYLLGASAKQGVLPLFYRQLEKHFGGELPEDRLSAFSQRFRQNAARNLLLTGELCRILKRFSESGIQAVPYKGPALAVVAYGDIALRQFFDLDVLVRPRDVVRAGAILVAEGYEPHFSVSGAQEEQFIRLSYVQLFEREDGQRAVELHWPIAPRFFSFAFDIDQLWERLETVTVGGAEVLTPSTEDWLLMLCVHAAKDMWERLEWVCAIAELIGDERRIDWERLVTRASVLGGKRMLLLGLFLAQQLLRTFLPEIVRREMETDKTIGGLAGEVCGRMFGEATAPRGVAHMARFHLKLKERLSDRIRYCALLATTTTPVDWATVRLPRPLAFLYYFLRPFRLARKYIFRQPRHVL